MVLLFLASCVASQTTPTPGHAVPTVQAMEDDWMHSLVAKDTATMAPILAPNFTLSGSNEQRETREQYLATTAMPERTLEPITLEDRAFENYSNTVISTGIATYKGRYKNNGFHFRIRYTNVYIFDNNEWKVAAAHISTINN